jgi:transposase InsO family protein
VALDGCAKGDVLLQNTESIGPKDRAEAIAIFRAQVIAPLCIGELARGERMQLLRELSERSFTPPCAAASRTFGMPTLERWLYRYRRGGLDALKPMSREKGAALVLTDAQRELLIQIRKEHPSASAELIVSTLEHDGRLVVGAVSPNTVRRLFRQHGLDKKSARAAARGSIRRRWQTAKVNDLWHADVCHGPALLIDGRSVPLRIHAILDDHSRRIIAIQACTTERESEMLMLLVRALRLHDAPVTLYLDNGATYSGDALQTVCARLGINLVHAKPYDPEARGKMERFWRTLRAGCLDHLGPMSSLHDVQVRLLAYLDQRYHLAPHASLMGQTPHAVYEHGRSKEPNGLSEARLADALTVHGTRRVRRDGTLELGGVTWETTIGFLAGRNVVVGRTLLDPTSAPWLEHEDQRYVLHRVDPVANASRPRSERVHRAKRGLDVAFDPPSAMLDAMLGRKRGES